EPSRLAEFVAVVIGDVGADEVVEGAVFGAALAEVDALALDDDLGVDEAPALWAQAARAAEIGVVAEVHEWLPTGVTCRRDRRRSRARSRRTRALPTRERRWRAFSRRRQGPYPIALLRGASEGQRRQGAQTQQQSDR